MEERDGNAPSLSTRTSKRRLLPSDEESQLEPSESPQPSTSGGNVSTSSSSIKVRIVDKETLHKRGFGSPSDAENSDANVETGNQRKSQRIDDNKESEKISVQITEDPIRIPISVVERKSQVSVGEEKREPCLLGKRQRQKPVQNVNLSQFTRKSQPSFSAVESPHGDHVLVDVQIPFWNKGKTKPDPIKMYSKANVKSGISLLKKSSESSETKNVPLKKYLLLNSTEHKVPKSKVSKNESNNTDVKPTNEFESSLVKETASPEITQLQSAGSSIRAIISKIQSQTVSEKITPKMTKADMNKMWGVASLQPVRNESVIIVDIPNTVAGLEKLPGVTDEEKNILDILSQIKGGDMCLPFCPPHCDVSHHPLLIAINHCREEEGNIEIKQRLFMSLLCYYYKQEKVKDRYKPWSLCDPIQDPITEYRKTAIDWAVCLGAVAVLDWLLKASDEHDVMARDQNGHGLLHHALDYLPRVYDQITAAKKFTVITSLIEGAVYVQDTDGNTPLHVCAEHAAKQNASMSFYSRCIEGIIETITSMDNFHESMLVELIGKQNKAGDTCLHFLLRDDCLLPNVRVILAALSKSSLHSMALIKPNHKGESALDIAIDGNCRQLLHLVTWHCPQSVEKFVKRGLPDAKKPYLDMIVTEKRQLKNSQKGLTPEEAYAILTTHKCYGKRLYHWTKSRYLPSGGTLYLIKKEQGKEELHMADGYNFVKAYPWVIDKYKFDRSGYRWLDFHGTLLPAVHKELYIVAGVDYENTPSLRKEVWSMIHPPSPYKLVHYLGVVNRRSKQHSAPNNQSPEPMSDETRNQAPEQVSEPLSKGDRIIKNQVLDVDDEKDMRREGSCTESQSVDIYTETITSEKEIHITSGSSQQQLRDITQDFNPTMECLKDTADQTSKSAASQGIDVMKALSQMSSSSSPSSQQVDSQCDPSSSHVVTVSIDEENQESTSEKSDANTLQLTEMTLGTDATNNQLVGPEEECNEYVSSSQDFVGEGHYKQSDRHDSEDEEVWEAGKGQEMKLSLKSGNGDRVMTSPEPVTYIPCQSLIEKLHDVIDDSAVADSLSTDLVSGSADNNSTSHKRDKSDKKKTFSQSNNTDIARNTGNRSRQRATRDISEKINILRKKPKKVVNPEHSDTDLDEFSGYPDLEGVDENELCMDPQSQDLMAAILTSLDDQSYEDEDTTTNVKIPWHLSGTGMTSMFMSAMDDCDASLRRDVMYSLTSQSRRLGAQIDNLEKLGDGLSARYTHIQKALVIMAMDLQLCVERRNVSQTHVKKHSANEAGIESKLAKQTKHLAGLNERLVHCLSALDVLEEITEEEKKN